EAHARRNDLATARALAQQAVARARQEKDEARAILLAGCLVSQGNFSPAPGEAEALYREALEVSQASGTEDLPAYPEALLRRAAGGGPANLALVEPLVRQMLEVTRRDRGEKHPEVTDWVRCLAGLHQQRGDLPAAEALWCQALEAERQRGGEKSSGYAGALR